MKRIVVIGSSNTDMIIQVPHLPGPGETVLGGQFTTTAGGKGANQAVAAARAGGQVTFIGAVGDDVFGRESFKRLAEDGIDTGLCIVDPLTPSGVAQIFVADDGENAIAVAPGANACLEPGHIDRIGSLFGPDTVVLLQLETPIDTVVHAARLAHDSGATVILNPAPAADLPDEIFSCLHYLTPNLTEVELLTGIAVSDDSSAAAATDALHRRGMRTVLLTRTADGVFYSRQPLGQPVQKQSWPAFRVNAVDTTAAGDVFNGCFAVAIAEGRALEEAIRFAQAGAALCVQTLGAQASAPGRMQVEAFMGL